MYVAFLLLKNLFLFFSKIYMNERNYYNRKATNMSAYSSFSYKYTTLFCKWRIDGWTATMNQPTNSIQVTFIHSLRLLKMYYWIELLKCTSNECTQVQYIPVDEPVPKSNILFRSLRSWCVWDDKEKTIF